MRDIQEQQDRKRMLKRTLEENCGGGKEARTAAKKKLCVYKKKVGIEFKGGSDTESVESYFEDSQESLVAEIVQCETNISDLKSQKDHQKRLLTKTMRDATNDSSK